MVKFKLEPTVDGILGIFTKLVDKLDAVVEAEKARADNAAVRIAEAQAEEAKHRAEVARAQKVRANISKLIG